MALWIKNADILTMDRRRPRAQSAVVAEGAFAFVTPPEIARDPEADGQYQAFMKQCYETYLSLADRLQARPASTTATCIGCIM